MSIFWHCNKKRHPPLQLGMPLYTLNYLFLIYVPIYGLQLYDIFGCGSPVTFFNIKTYLISLLKALESGHIYCRVMDKNITAILLLYEPESFFIVEPLYNSFCHLADLLSKGFMLQKLGQHSG